MNVRRRLIFLGAAGLLTAAVGACTDNSSSDASASTDPNHLSVSSTADACDVSAETAPSGNLIFSVKNAGDEVTEFYLLGSDGVRIVGEVENIGPGLQRDLVVRAEPGEYVTACKPGMKGDGIRGALTVTDSGSGSATSDDMTELEAAATTQYKAYVQQQAATLLTGTKAFADAYRNGQDDQARDLYASTRTYWESIEPVAESFGDLDPRLDLREADLEEGQEWTGWHRIEKDLWPPAEGATPATPEQRQQYADQLVADTQELVDRINQLELSADQMGNGAKELLDEVATGKVTGEEEAWSHTDLWDFQANVDGARIAYQALRPIVVVKDPALATTLDERFAAIQTELDKYRAGDGFVLYTNLTPAQVRELSDAVSALGEPLSNLTATVVL
ncbi:MAG: cupredoxin domain-containing protein [Acidimicrobiia bacterium]|nr:cupredoxin domain-containing protein [Acidimicrobiia bacterium]